MLIAEFLALLRNFNFSDDMIGEVENFYIEKKQMYIEQGQQLVDAIENKQSICQRLGIHDDWRETTYNPHALLKMFQDIVFFGKQTEYDKDFSHLTIKQLIFWTAEALITMELEPCYLDNIHHKQHLQTLLDNI